MKHHYVKWLVALMLGLGFSGCQTTATPQTAKVKLDDTRTMHTLVKDVAIYKGYTILQDNGRNTMVIKYARDKSWSITYKVVNTNNTYTFSYVDSRNLNYKNGKISRTYVKLIQSIQGTVAKSLKDPEYYARLKVQGQKRQQGPAIAVQKNKPSAQPDSAVVSVEDYNFFAE